MVMGGGGGLAAQDIEFVFMFVWELTGADKKPFRQEQHSHKLLKSCNVFNQNYNFETNKYKIVYVKLSFSGWG